MAGNWYIDNEILIALIEARPVLWDKSHKPLDIFGVKRETKRAWTEIFAELDNDLDELDEVERNEFGNAVMKRWGNIRDSYVKSFKNRNGTTTSGVPYEKRKYIYHDQLQFLNKIAEEQEMADSPSANEENPQEGSDLESYEQTSEHGSNEEATKKSRNGPASRSDPNIEIDVELLILLVEVRPILWDKTLKVYKDRFETEKAWTEIFLEMNSDFEQLGDIDKIKFGKEVMKKWANIRDCYVKSLKKHKHLKRRTRTGVLNVKKYVYHDQLQFLNRVLDEHQMPDISSTDVPREGSDVETSTGHASEHGNNEKVTVTPRMELRTRKRKLDEVDMKMIQALEERPSDRHLFFFKGIIPSLQKLDEDEVVEFQLGVLQLMSDIKQQKRMYSAVSITNCTSLSLNHEPEEVDQDVKPIIADLLK